MRTLIATIACVVCSVAVVRLGVAAGHRWLPPGAGAPRAGEPDLFRFDSSYYLSIANEGYAYDGDPLSSPNIVFAPLFPWMIRAAPGIDPVTFGFLLNFAALVAGVALAYRALAHWWGARVAFVTVLAQTTAAGSWAFHAFYAEAVTFFCFALALHAWARGRSATLALAGFGLGAARTVGLFPALIIAVTLLTRVRDKSLSPARGIALAGLSVAGSALYLGLIAHGFGNPFTLLPTIQSASWGLFHPPTDWSRVVTLSYLGEYAAAAWTRGFDVRTLNLGWTILALISVPFGFAGAVPRGCGAMFAAYAAATYALDASSEYLISAPRFFVLMTPIFLTFARAVLAPPRVISAATLALGLTVNAGFALWHAACFNQGWWFYF